MPTKKETIETVYFGPDGFGSLKQITKDAQAKDDTITYDDVKEWKSKQSFGQKSKPRGSNSFIAQEPYQEYQCDLCSSPNLDPVNYNEQGLHGGGNSGSGPEQIMPYS